MLRKKDRRASGQGTDLQESDRSKADSSVGTTQVEVATISVLAFSASC